MEPTISVGILSAQHIDVVLNGTYLLGDERFEGAQSFSLENDRIIFNNRSFEKLIFHPLEAESASFDLIDVVIGIGFHWERKETQRFQGELKFIIEKDKITAINTLPVEDYLLSVITSEMSATSSLELLKAHAVTSRSWLLAQLEAKQNNFSTVTSHVITSKDEFIKWYDKDDHANFDVCADDHCQRYQGISRGAGSEAVKQAIEATRGEVILHAGKVCDARFSKCCGGVAELFENCWEPEHHAYLLPLEDKPQGSVRSQGMNETEVTSFIKNPATGDFCNTTDTKVLSQVLNSYDQETPDFYRWTVKYTQAEIAVLLNRNASIDFGHITDLIPIERGISGRITKLKIVGSKRTLTIGKELEIRKWLSNSHLYSSAFIIEKGELQNGIPSEFTLLGAGWGHGVGLCQIGAAVMAEEGYAYKDIVAHYFRNSELTKIY